MGIFKSLFKGLKKTRDAFAGLLASVFKGGYSREEFFEQLEYALISADVGVNASGQIVEKLRETVKEEKIKSSEYITERLKEIITEFIDTEELVITYPAVIMIVGVNGTGKTTTIGKLAHYFTKQGKSVVIAAGDTFRAAASAQLDVWAKRANVRIISQGEGSDPSAVVFDAIMSAKAKNTDVLLIDTAGRLHNKANLMEELKKMNRIINREFPQSQKYNFLVIDATTGQNAIIQANAFNEAVKLDGIILTKLDGTAKGGVVININTQHNMPVRFIGTGEKIDDLEPFDAKKFVDGIL